MALDGSREGGSGARRAGAVDRLIAAIAFVTFATLVVTRSIFNDGDTSWHLAAGRLIVESRSVPETDPFSFTFLGQPWTAHEWLAEAVMALTFSTTSWAGLAVLTALAVALVVLIVGSELRRWLPPVHAAAILLMLLILLAPFILARPHVLAWPLLAGWTLVLIRARERHVAPPLAAALLMLVWANLHGSFLFGLLLVGAFALEALIAETDRKRVILGWGRFGLVALGLSLATPHGLEALLFPLQVSGMETLSLIGEWRPTGIGDWEFLAAAGATVLVLVHRMMTRGVRVSIVRLVILAAILFLALQHVRHQAVFAILAALLVPPVLAGNQAKDAATGAALRWDARVLFVLVGGIVAVAAIRVAIPVERVNSASNPVTAIAALPAGLRSRPVLNTYEFGGPLILAGIRPYIDGRADMYQDAFFLDHQAMMKGDLDRFRRAATRWGIGWTLLKPGEPLVRRLDRMPGWRRVYADQWAVVHVAGAAAPAR